MRNHRRETPADKEKPSYIRVTDSHRGWGGGVGVNLQNVPGSKTIMCLVGCAGGLKASLQAPVKPTDISLQAHGAS